MPDTEAFYWIIFISEYHVAVNILQHIFPHGNALLSPPANAVSPSFPKNLHFKTWMCLLRMKSW